MNSFVLYNPVKIIFGDNTIETVNKYIPQGCTILITYGKGSIKKNGIYNLVKASLSAYRVIDFGGIEANPHYETLLEAVELGRKEKVDFILAVGGGSVIDGTKLIAAAIPYQGDAWELVTSGGIKIETAIPFGTVLTLPATGSEMNMGAVITKASIKEKLSFRNPVCFPKFSILDPIVVNSLPKHQIANGIIDAFVHVMEQYLVASDTLTPIQDGFSETILRTLIEQGQKVYQNINDTEAIKHFMFAATMALNGLIGSGIKQDWSTHMIGHEITALYGIDHARTLAIILPGLWLVMKEKKRDKLIQYAKNVWNLEGNENELVQKAIEQTEAFFHSLGVNTKLTDYTDEPEKAQIIPKKIKERRWKLGELGLIDHQKVDEILKLRM